MTKYIFQQAQTYREHAGQVFTSVGFERNGSDSWFSPN